MNIRKTIIVTVGLLVIDRALKIAVTKGLLGGSFLGFRYPRFTFHQNFGLAFDLPISRSLVIGMSLIIIVILVAITLRIHRRAPAQFFPLLLITAGAASNLYDRLRFGYVIDVIEMFPRSVWNVADVMILIGILMLVFRKNLETRN